MGRRHLARRGIGRFTRPTIETAVEAPVEALVEALVRGPCARCGGTGEVWNGPEPGRDWWVDACPVCVENNTCPQCGGELDGYCECPAAACGWPD